MASAMFGVTKTEDGESYPASAYAYVPDPKTPSTWKLRLWESPSKKETAAQVGRAVAALGKGFRGNKVQIPSSARAGVIAKVRAAWKRQNKDKSADEMPSVLKSSKMSLSYRDLESALTSELNQGFSGSPYYVKDIIEEDSGQMQVVYTNWNDGSLYIRDFEVDDSGDVTLAQAQPAQQKTSYEVISFSQPTGLLDVVFGATDETIQRRGKIFTAGDWVDGHGVPFEMSEDELQDIVEAFEPVQINLDHHITVLDGKLGQLSSVSLSDGNLYGTVELPIWLNDVLGDEPVGVSTEWDRDTKQLTKLALAVNPVITDAQISAAFAKFAGARHSASDMKDIQAMHDLAVKQGATCVAPKKGAKMSHERDGNMNHTQEQERVGMLTSVLRALGFGAEPQPTTPTVVPATPPPQTKPADAKPEDDRIAQLEKRLNEERKLRVASEAAAFADRMITDRRIVPAERDAVVREYETAANDDVATGTKVTFSATTQSADGKSVTETKEGGRVDALAARYAIRPQHSLTQPTVPTTAVVLSGPHDGKDKVAFDQPTKDGEEMSEERRKHLFSKTTLGQQVTRIGAQK